MGLQPRYLGAKYEQELGLWHRHKFVRVLSRRETEQGVGLEMIQNLATLIERYSVNPSSPQA